jgi:hypothetical protein
MGLQKHCETKRTISKNHYKVNSTTGIMEKLQFIIAIQAPVTKVVDTMLGLTDKSTYEQWTALFNPTSTYEGNWNKGSKILFVGTDASGEKGGMVSEIVEHVAHQFVSIRHYGLVKNGVEITSGAEVEQWANGLENYTFKENKGITELTVEVDTHASFTNYMKEKYPLALAKLKQVCEGE